MVAQLWPLGCCRAVEQRPQLLLPAGRMGVLTGNRNQPWQQLSSASTSLTRPRRRSSADVGVVDLGVTTELYHRAPMLSVLQSPVWKRYCWLKPMTTRVFSRRGKWIAE